MPETSLPTAQILSSFERQRIMVVGDLMLDRYTFGRATRISPEAPVPVLDFEREENRLGGAANVALNLQALGASPILFGVVGADRDGKILLGLLAEQGISTDGILSSTERMTTVKARIMAGRQQLVRLDMEQTHDLTEQESERFLANALGALEGGTVTGLLFQDYNKGVLTPFVIKTLAQVAEKHGVPVFVDPKHRNFWSYQGASLFKPNLKEVREALNAQIDGSLTSLRAASSEIRTKIGCKNILITLSEQGLFLDDGSFSEIVGTKPRLVADPCGAGDTVISIVALAQCAGLSAVDIALLANLAGGQVVERSGVAVVDKHQLMEEFYQHKNEF